MSSFTVVYDACVLYSAAIRDLLLWLALEDVFRARWSEQILDEMERAILRNRPDIDPARIRRTRQKMNVAVRDGVVTDYEKFVGGIELPDADDRHVVAAAMRCHAQIIVTFNLKDFPSEVLKPLGIQAQHPDDFLEHLLDLHQHAVLHAVREQRASLTNPEQSIEQLLDTFSAQSLPKTVAILRQFASLL